MSDVLAVASGTASGSDSPLAEVASGALAVGGLTAMYLRNRRDA